MLKHTTLSQCLHLFKHHFIGYGSRLDSTVFYIILGSHFVGYITFSIGYLSNTNTATTGILVSLVYFYHVLLNHYGLIGLLQLSKIE